MNTGFVICSRAHSSRVPNKAFIKYNGKTHIEHLVDRLLLTEIPVHIAVPQEDLQSYIFLMDIYPKRVRVHSGFSSDPLRRMYGVAKNEKLDTIIRVTHDKIFVDQSQVFEMLGRFHRNKLDYGYSSDLVDGTGFELMSFRALEKAAQRFENIEHISYALKSVTDNQENISLKTIVPPDGVRLLVDYPEDVQLMNLIFASLGTNCQHHDVLEFLMDNPWAKEINRLPEVTVYTCAYNAERWLDEAMGSVASQVGFGFMEYLLFDDCSLDKTALKMAKFCNTFSNAKWFRNPANLGLASSSNRALHKAKGKYIIRLDADDVIAYPQAISELHQELADRKLDAVYPSNYVGFSRDKVASGDVNHHIGGALFKTAAVNHVKFTEGLRNYEGLDFFTRARKQLKIGYFAKPTFIYRQHSGSMSKNNLKEREKTKQEILSVPGQA
jgi:spore coat polysaccharide biosynthesis protein SpsF (cytidylyltransferase family)